MFGSSQDRARQLASRVRKQRIISGGRHSGHHSVSSSKQPSQPSHISAGPKHQIQRPPVAPEHPSPGIGLTHSGPQTSGGSCAAQELNDEQTSPPTTDDVAEATRGRLPSQTEQHRLQAEYLSQVLYNSLTLSAFYCPPQSQFRITSRHTRYGSLGMQPATSHPLRNNTAPVPTTQASTEQLEILQTQLGLHMLPSIQKSAFEDHSWIQGTIALRGGAGDDDPPSDPNHGKSTEIDQSKILIPDRPFTHKFPWVRDVYQLEQWETPIASGPELDKLLDSFSKEQFDRCRFLFDEAGRSSQVMTPSQRLIARKRFFGSLTSEQQRWFRDLITMRGLHLLKWRAGHTKDMDSQEWPLPQDGSKLRLKLFCLLEATENQHSTSSRAAPSLWFKGSQTMSKLPSATSFTGKWPTMTPLSPGLSTYSGPSNLRASSLPNLGQHRRLPWSGHQLCLVLCPSSNHAFSRSLVMITVR